MTTDSAGDDADQTREQSSNRELSDSAGSEDESEDDPAAEDAREPADPEPAREEGTNGDTQSEPSGPDSASEADDSSSPPGPSFEDVRATAHGNQVWINYTVKDAERSWVEWGEDALTNRVNGTPGEGAKSVSLDLDYETSYLYLIGAQGAGGTVQGHASSVTTAAWPFSWATAEDALIRPGIRLNLENSGGCTLGFILTSPDNSTLYALTAGHCAGTGVGGAATAPDASITFGEIVHLRNDYISDHALIQIDPAFRQNVSPSMIHWTGPSGLPTDGEVVRKDTLCFFGQSTDMRWGKNHASCGPSDGFEDWDVNGWTIQQVLFRAEANAGDSGSPVIDYTSGKAVGILTRLETETAMMNSRASSICSILTLLEADGFDLRLATSRYDPPAPTDPPAYAESAPQSIDADSDEMIGCADDFAGI